MKIFTGNFLKLVALIVMLIDHFAFYFNYILDDSIYLVLRSIGRISMPLFAFLIVEGFLHTKNLKRYLIRLFMFAIITQASLILMDKYMYAYNKNSYHNISCNLNILFSFSFAIISLCLVKKIIYYIKNISEKNKARDILIILLYIFIVLLISLLFFIFKFDYGIKAYILIILIYLANIFCDFIFFETNFRKGKLLFKYIIYFIIFISIFNKLNDYSIFANIALIFIYLYNGKRGKDSKIIKYLFYITFVLQHIILYSVSAIFCKY